MARKAKEHIRSYAATHTQGHCEDSAVAEAEAIFPRRRGNHIKRPSVPKDCFVPRRRA